MTGASTTPLRADPADWRDRWRATHAALRCLVVVLAVAPIALLWRRPDLLVLAAPFAVVLAWSVVTRPHAVPARRFDLSHSLVREGEQVLAVSAIEPVEGAEVLSAAVSPAPYVEGVVQEKMRPVRDLEGVEKEPQALGLRVLPQPAAFDTSAPAPHPRGLVGQHRSARPGDGAEFATLRPFQVGDRLRRIHWPRSTREPGQLYVTSSYADQDTHVAVLLDAHYDLGVSGGIDGDPSSLDRSVRAAAAVSEHFLQQGDRVSLRVLSARTPLTVPIGTGKRHGIRILDTLCRVVPSVDDQTDPATVHLGVKDGTLVVMISALVSPDALTQAAMLAARGISVVVIDALVDPRDGGVLPSVEKDALARTAWRIRLLEREREIRGIQAQGVAVVPWLGPGSLDMVLRELARRGRRAGV